MERRLLPIVIIISLAIGFLGGYQYRQSPAVISLDGSTDNSNHPDLGLFWQVWDAIHQRYVDKSKINDTELLYGAIDGLVKKVGDPYTTFFTPKESQSFAQEIDGAFGGIGIEIGVRNDILTVISPIKGTPAERAGLRAGDKIVKIGDKATNDLTVSDAVNLIRGKKGTPIELTIVRNGDKTSKTLSILRDTIKIPAVKLTMLDDTTAHLEVYIFNKNVDSEFDKAAREIAKSKARNIILDLRNNPGGLLDSAVNLSGYFLDPNSLVTIEKKGDGTTREYRTSGNPILKNYKVVILINKGSASASEIVSGALKDNLNTVLIGEKSFGKGSVQEVIDLPKGTSLKITVAKWLTPKGISINENGINPDIAIERTDADITADKDPQLDKAKQFFSSK